VGPLFHRERKSPVGKPRVEIDGFDPTLNDAVEKALLKAGGQQRRRSRLFSELLQVRGGQRLWPDRALAIDDVRDS
jgi:hypothetical protein